MSLITKKDLDGQLALARTLAIQVNPVPAITHKLKVLKKLRLVDEESPQEFEKEVWKAMLIHWDTDQSHALGHGVVYLEGDTIQVDRFEAAELLRALPEYFEPVDDLTRQLAEVIAAGTIEGGQG